jgi:cysteine sulfinate desulfinase/cysteine desulfurase-like protein
VTEHPAVLAACRELEEPHGAIVGHKMYAPKGIAALSMFATE